MNNNYLPGRDRDADLRLARAEEKIRQLDAGLAEANASLAELREIQRRIAGPLMGQIADRIELLLRVVKGAVSGEYPPPPGGGGTGGKRHLRRLNTLTGFLGRHRVAGLATMAAAGAAMALLGAILAWPPRTATVRPSVEPVVTASPTIPATASQGPSGVPGTPGDHQGYPGDGVTLPGPPEGSPRAGSPAASANSPTPKPSASPCPSSHVIPTPPASTVPPMVLAPSITLDTGIPVPSPSC